MFRTQNPFFKRFHFFFKFEGPLSDHTLVFLFFLFLPKNINHLSLGTSKATFPREKKITKRLYLSRVEDALKDSPTNKITLTYVATNSNMFYMFTPNYLGKISTHFWLAAFFFRWVCFSSNHQAEITSKTPGGCQDKASKIVMKRSNSWVKVPSVPRRIDGWMVGSSSDDVWKVRDTVLFVVLFVFFGWFVWDLVVAMVFW